MNRHVMRLLFSGIPGCNYTVKICILSTISLVLVAQMWLVFQKPGCNESVSRQDPSKVLEKSTLHGAIRVNLTVLEMNENVPEVYKERRRQLGEACANMDPSFYKGKNDETATRKHFMVDRKNELVYCYIEKVGCSFWKRVLLVLAENGNDYKGNPFAIPGRYGHLNPPGLEQFTRLPFAEIHKILSSYTKFLFVREPYSRLFSGYVDKMFSPDEQFFWLRQHIASLTRTENRTWECGTEITFAEFVKYVIHFLEMDKSHFREDHFVQMFDHCRPCEIDYDVIGKMESFLTDTGYILRSRGLGSRINLDIVQREIDRDAIDDEIDYFFHIEHKIKQCMPFTHAIKRMWRKLQIRGLLEKAVELPSRFELKSNVTKAEFKDAIMEAYHSSNRAKSLANKKEALAEAFSSVPADDINKFRRIFHADFELFGYNISLLNSFYSQNKFFFSEEY